jgi:hypothetical protein
VQVLSLLGIGESKLSCPGQQPSCKSGDNDAGHKAKLTNHGKKALISMYITEYKAQLKDGDSVVEKMYCIIAMDSYELYR